MMQGAEISHIILIDRMILSKYREFMYLNSMKGLQQVIRDAITFLTSLPPENVMFAKILYGKDETAILNRKSLS